MIIRMLRPLARMLSRRWQKCCRFRYQTSARLMAGIAGGKLDIAKKVYFNVPLRVDGEGTVILGDHVSIGATSAARFGTGEVVLQARAPSSEIRICSGTATNNNVAIYACERVDIGRDCLIGEFVAIYDSNFHDTEPELRRTSSGPSASVRIGDRVWLGSRVMVLKGVEIGDDSVIAAGAVVTKSIPAGVVAGGVPAKIIRTIGDDENRSS